MLLSGGRVDNHQVTPTQTQEEREREQLRDDGDDQRLCMQTHHIRGVSSQQSTPQPLNLQLPWFRWTDFASESYMAPCPASKQVLPLKAMPTTQGWWVSHPLSRSLIAVLGQKLIFSVCNMAAEGSEDSHVQGGFPSGGGPHLNFAFCVF